MKEEDLFRETTARLRLLGNRVADVAMQASDYLGNDFGVMVLVFVKEDPGLLVLGAGDSVPVETQRQVLQAHLALLGSEDKIQ